MAIPLSLSNVPDETPYIQYVANNGQTVYPYPFPITQDSDLVVVINGITQNTDSTYTLSGQGNPTGGNVTLNSGSNADDIVTLYRDIQIERLTQFAQNGGFSSSAFNAEFNNLYLIAQQLESSIEQCLQLPNTNNPRPVTTLTPAAYAGKYLAFDVYGNPIPAALILSGAVTSALLGGLLYPATTLELGVTGLQIQYPYGSFRRYGMDPTGATASDTAFANACKCNAEVFDDFPGGGSYLFNTGVTLSYYPLKIRGQGRWFAGGTDTGTKFTLGSAAGAGAALLKFTGGPLYSVEITGVGFTFQSATLGQFSIHAATDFRGSIIEKCAFVGPVNAASNTTAILFDTTTTYTGALSIRDNFFDAVNVGILMNGTCTTVKITNNEFIGYSTGTQVGNAIQMNSLVQGAPQITSNYFEGWGFGILGNNGASGIVQIGNIYAVCTTSFEWIGTSGVKNVSLGEQVISGAGVPVYNTSDTAGNVVIGAGSFIAAANFTTTRTFTEGNNVAARAYPMGYPQTVTFSAGNFTGNGSMSWTVISSGQSTFTYSITGKTLTVWFNITGTVGGTPSTALQIALPGGFIGAANVASVGQCSITNGGASSVSACQVNANGNVIQVFTTAAGSGSWSAGSVNAAGQIQIQVA